MYRTYFIHVQYVLWYMYETSHQSTMERNQSDEASIYVEPGYVVPTRNKSIGNQFKTIKDRESRGGPIACAASRWGKSRFDQEVSKKRKKGSSCMVRRRSIKDVRLSFYHYVPRDV